MKKVTSLFLDIVYKLKNDSLKVKNVVFTRNLDNIDKHFEELYSNKIISKDGVGLKVKEKDKVSENVLAYSYFIDEKRLPKFIDNLENEIDNLYNIWV